jgi:hypothetical protein
MLLIAGSLTAPASAGDLPGVTQREGMRACTAFGPGFFYIPGSDTCVRLGGRVRAELLVNQTWSRLQDEMGSRVRGRIEAEARAKHLKELANIASNNGPKLAGAIEAGSQEAFAATLNAQGFDLGGDNAINMQKDTNKLLEKIAESNERFEKLMEELNGKWGGGF